MGCIVSKSFLANKQPNKSGKGLLGTSNTLLELYTEEYITYGPETVERVLLRALGVSDFQEKQIPVRFEEKPQSEQENILILIYMYMNLQDFKQDSLVIEALRETKFVTNGDGDLYKPKDLFDPCDSLLTSVFSDEAHRFPGERFTSGGWLNILRETGLQNMGDADIVLECARKIELLGTKSKKRLWLAADNKLDFLKSTSEVSVEIWSLAEALMSSVLKNFDALYGNNSFCNCFGEIACIPAETGFPFESGKKRGKRVLCSYSEAILLKDSHLAWSVAPILYKESLVPPEYSWGAMQLRSPPPFTIVYKHLKVSNNNNRGGNLRPVG